MLTASYLSPELKELHQQAVDVDITIFNEIGFDPGIDHMLSMQSFDDVHEKGGKVFYCCIMHCRLVYSTLFHICKHKIVMHVIL